MRPRRLAKQWYAILLEEKTVRVGRSKHRVSVFHVSNTARDPNQMLLSKDCDFIVGRQRIYVRAISKKAKLWMFDTFEEVPHSCIMSWSVEHKDEIEAKLKEAELTYG